MTFRKVKDQNEARCGELRITWAIGPGGRTYYNGWNGQKHITSGWDKEQVKLELISHKSKLLEVA